MPVTGKIFHIAGCSVHDGPGIRTAVYFKGCNLSCLWCHNPEGQVFGREVAFTPERCIGCGVCAELCPEHHRVENGVLRFYPEGCTACGKCVRECYAHALSLWGEEMTAEAVMERILRDRIYYESTGGGVTFSGGECLLQPELLTELLRRCREEGIHTLVESAFCVPENVVERVFPYVSAFYVDVKHMDSALHRQYTGAGNEQILHNIAVFAPRHPDLTVRVPLIPGVNDSMENLLETARFAGRSGVRKMELLRYNPLGEAKYRQLGRKATVFGAPQEAKEMETLCGELCRAVPEVTTYFVL